MAYSTINKSTDYFNTKLYTGTGAIQTVSGVGFEPSWIWTKSRTNAGNHQVTDQVRGLTKYIRPNASNAEDTKTNAITAVNSDGFVLGADSSNDINASGQNYASWNWKANGQGSSNTDGTINTTYTSANTTSGFSIVKWTGTGANATVGHGLGVAPKMIIFKNTNTATDWDVYHGSLANTERIHLNTTGAKNTAAHAFNSTSPTTSVFSVGTADNTNKSSSPMIAYCFAEKQGYSKFSSYVGNANADGTFVYTGFKPAFLLLKNTAISDNWSMFNNKALGYNTYNHIMYPDLTNTESNGLPIDFYSNGFKWRTTAGMANGNGQQHIFMAFAEAPLVGSNNVPATAR